MVCELIVFLAVIKKKNWESGVVVVVVVAVAVDVVVDVYVVVAAVAAVVVGIGFGIVGSDFAFQSSYIQNLGVVAVVAFVVDIVVGSVVAYEIVVVEFAVAKMRVVYLAEVAKAQKANYWGKKALTTVCFLVSVLQEAVVVKGCRVGLVVEIVKTVAGC